MGRFQYLLGILTFSIGLVGVYIISNLFMPRPIGPTFLIFCIAIRSSFSVAILKIRGYFLLRFCANIMDNVYRPPNHIHRFCYRFYIIQDIPFTRVAPLVFSYGLPDHIIVIYLFLVLLVVSLLSVVKPVADNAHTSLF